MTLFRHRSGLFVLVLVAAWMSAWEPGPVHATPPISPIASEISPLPLTDERRSSVVLFLTAQQDKTLHKEATTQKLRGKMSPARAQRRDVARKKTRKKLRTLHQQNVKPDLSYHGILESPRRYDPSLSQQSGAVPNPKARDLRVDHFQELDKNHDGVLDPLERATSRLDIDRDLIDRRWK